MGARLTVSFFSRHPGVGRDPVTLCSVVAQASSALYQRFRDLAAYAASVPPSCRRPGHFLLLAQEKVTKEKGPPDEAPIGQSPIGTRPGSGLFDGAPAPTKSAWHPCQVPLRGLISTRPPPHTGTRKIKSESRRLVPLRGTLRRGRREAPAPVLELDQNFRSNAGSLTVIPAKAGIQCL